MSLKITHTTLAFQKRAATLLVASAPAVSAHLQASQQAVATEANIELADDSSICKACGSTLILGWTCRTSSTKSRKQSRQNRINSPDATKSVHMQCSACNNINVIVSRKPGKKIAKGSRITKKARESTKDALVNTPAVSLNSAQPTSITASESGAKKRGRNKKSTLQSMLAERKPSTATKGFGLNMMDFVK